MMNGENRYAIINFIDNCGKFDIDFVSDGEVACTMIQDYYRSSTCTVQSIEFVDEETFLNKKLEVRLKEHEDFYEDMKDICSLIINDRMGIDVAIATINCIRDNIRTCENQIRIIMNRMRNHDVELDPRNELAVEILNGIDSKRKELTFV